MTDLQRLAEKVVLCCNGDCDCLVHASIFEHIESLLSEAMEAQEKKYEGYLQSLRDDWKADSNERQSFIEKLEKDLSTAYTRAAEVARSYKGEGCVISVDGEAIAAAIERLREDK